MLIMTNQGFKKPFRSFFCKDNSIPTKVILDFGGNKALSVTLIPCA